MTQSVRRAVGDLRIIGAALVAAFPATAQVAPTLAEFELRCLVPMIEVRETDVSGLARIPHRAAWESWVPESGDWELRRALPQAVVQYCAIHGGFGDEVDQWAEGAIASGAFERVEGREPETLQSVFIREQVIEVEIDREGESLTVVETNLES